MTITGLSRVELPEVVRSYLDRLLFHPAAVACLELRDGQRRWHGEISQLGLPDESWLDDLLVGLPDNENVRLPLVQAAEGVALQFHQICAPSERYLLLLTADEAYAAVQTEQQQAHELALRSRQQDQLILALEKAADVLAQSEAELRRVGRVQELFIGAMSHELGTPLTAVLGHLELLLCEPHSHTTAQRLAAVRRGVVHLNTLVQGALDRDRLARGELRIEPVALALRPLVEEVAALFEPQLAARGLVLELFSTDCIVRSDPLRLRQILINLLSNAVKYSHSGILRILLRPQAGAVRLCVQDCGPGLSVEQQQRMFEPYERFHSGPQPGHGLGLFVVRQLAAALGAKLGMDSAPAGGCEFWIELPGVMPNSDPAVQVAPIDRAAVLVIDDDPELRELLEVLFVARGHRVVTAPTLNLTAVREAAVECMLIDLELADGCSGLDVIKTLREAGFGGRIVATSANDAAPVAARAIAAGATAFIGKPFVFERLFEIFDGHVATRKSAVPAPPVPSKPAGEGGQSAGGAEQLREPPAA